MDVSHCRPRSFKMDRKSPLALELKETVLKKLLEFLGNYSDDVLAEYIVVLVCNGKRQDQARDDLEAFLGDSCNSFIDWLWGYLSEKVKPSKASAATSSLRKQSSKDGDSHATEVNFRGQSAKNRDSHATEIVEVENNQIQPPLLEGCNADKSKSESVVLVASTATTADCPDCTFVSTDMKKKCRYQYRSGTIGSSFTNKSYIRDAPHGSAFVGCHPINQETCVKDIDCGGQIKQIVGGAHAASCDQNFQASTEKPAFINPRLGIAENADARVSGRDADDIVANHVTSKRTNVWDRLGRPAEENAVAKDEQVIVGAFNGMKRQKEALPEEMLGSRVVLSGNRLNKRLIGEAIASEKDWVKSKKNTDVGQFQRPEQLFAMKRQQHVFKKKNQYLDFNSSNDSVPSVECVDKHISYEGVSGRFPEASDVQCGFTRNLNFVGDGTRKTSSLSSGLRSPSSISLSKISSSLQNQKEMKERPPSAEMKADKFHASQDGCYADVEMEHTGHGSKQSEVQDVKLRLHQIEMEMQKLRSKHSEINSEIKPHELSNSGGRSMLPHPDEDIESRTVFLTNVHFAATKEALHYHFMKCGPVIKVIILTDAVTSQPNGSAYIIFADKKAANNAIALNGTSFMSRILKIERKSDVSTTPAKPLRISAHDLSLPPENPSYAKKTPFVKRQYITSHLQWKRDTGNDSLSGTAAGSNNSSVADRSMELHSPT
ncbi:uncharacterized protein LOC116266755 isoform X2 [Nymphaea colorata]|uniref:uncharacterized protein LOC116266755 isoform X2 n=1 Tax=Nymphaea colorata TaxID=210225 RepID=UPI00214E919F|nr:uncharacterized protein LOC116266755 isoform X2 [Nymphaea colorata]